ncbi:MAG: hypothetical protein LBC09_00170 [Helicobacteraceae bacterium]|jgi:hypothetical protein|nr:hypothetical protein [Helicobacteraceae bacterium]
MRWSRFAPRTIGARASAIVFFVAQNARNAKRRLMGIKRAIVVFARRIDRLLETAIERLSESVFAIAGKIDQSGDPRPSLAAKRLPL